MMKINFMGYEVELKARVKCINNRNNKTDELSFVNTLICLMYDSANRAEIKAEIAEIKGDTNAKEIHQNYKELMLKYARELTKDYENEKGV